MTDICTGKGAVDLGYDPFAPPRSYRVSVRSPILLDLRSPPLKLGAEAELWRQPALFNPQPTIDEPLHWGGRADVEVTGKLSRRLDVVGGIGYKTAGLTPGRSIHSGFRAKVGLQLKLPRSSLGGDRGSDTSHSRSGRGGALRSGEAYLKQAHWETPTFIYGIGFLVNVLLEELLPGLGLFAWLVLPLAFRYGHLFRDWSWRHPLSSLNWEMANSGAVIYLTDWKLWGAGAGALAQGMVMTLLSCTGPAAFIIAAAAILPFVVWLTLEHQSVNQQVFRDVGLLPAISDEAVHPIAPRPALRSFKQLRNALKAGTML